MGVFTYQIKNSHHMNLRRLWWLCIVRWLIWFLDFFLFRRKRKFLSDKSLLLLDNYAWANSHNDPEKNCREGQCEGNFKFNLFIITHESSIGEIIEIYTLLLMASHSLHFKISFLVVISYIIYDIYVMLCTLCFVPFNVFFLTYSIIMQILLAICLQVR